MRIYLAGNMTDPHIDAVSWRQQVKKSLPEYEFIDPTELPSNIHISQVNYIVERDLRYVRESDLVLAELYNEHAQYVGTSMEIREAYIHGIPIIVWGEPKSLFAQYHAIRIPRFENVIEFLRLNKMILARMRFTEEDQVTLQVPIDPFEEVG